MKPSSRLAQQLANDQLGRLFVWPQHDGTVTRIWSKLGMHTLEEVVEDRDASARGRFVAAEVLFSNEPSFVDRHDHAMIAALYARALAERAAGSANPWGLLWIDDGVGLLGSRFVALGAAAIAPLRELLHNDTVVDWYTGGEEAAAGNGARYRIKDFAAFYLARILGVPLPAHPEPAERDAEIATLLAALDARPSR